MPSRDDLPIEDPDAVVVPADAVVAPVVGPAPVDAVVAPVDAVVTPAVEPGPVEIIQTADGPTVVSTPEKTAIIHNEPPVGPVEPAVVGGLGDRFGLGMLIGLLALLAVGGVIAAILLTRHHDHTVAQTTTEVTTVVATQGAAAVVVPNLIGQRQADASAALRAAGFTVRVVSANGPAPSGVVLSEDPAPSQSAPASSVVTLSVSDGAATTPPATTTAVVTTTAPATTVTTTTRTKTPAKQVTTTVVQTTTAQAPTASSAATTQATTTAASTTPTTPAAPSAPATAQVPDVTGKDVQAAAAALQSAGFLVSIGYVPGTDPLGTVGAENPTAGGSASTGSHVTVNASSGPGQKTQESVPDATGKTIPEAVAAMNQAGLRLFLLKKTVSDRSEAGKVVEQSPAPGKTAPHNAQVLVYMGAFKQSTN